MMTRPEDTTPAHYQERPLGQALDFLRVLWAINHGLATTSRYMKTKFGVTGRQRLIIQVVNEFPGLSAGDLAKVLHLDPCRPMRAIAAGCASSSPRRDDE